MMNTENTALQMIAEAARCPDYGPDMGKALMEKLDMNEKGFALLMNVALPRSGSGPAVQRSHAEQQSGSCRFTRPGRRSSARLPEGSRRQMGGIYKWHRSL